MNFHHFLGTNINNSLMVLGQVISKLSDGASVGHVPFRNSKLTRILKNSLGGNTKTAIVCTVTPAELVQTKSTLEFAARAKSIVQHAHVNEILDERAQMNRLRKEITDLQKQVNQFQHSELAEMNEQLARKNEDLVKKLQNQMLMSSWTDAAQVLVRFFKLLDSQKIIPKMFE
jgi:centromeric protein E